MHDYYVALFAVMVPVLLACFGKFVAWSLGRSIGDKVDSIVTPKIQEVHTRIDEHMDREEEALRASRLNDEWQAQAIMLIAQDRGMTLPPPPTPL